MTFVLKLDGNLFFSGNDMLHKLRSQKIDVQAKFMRICPINDPDLGDPEVALRVEFYVCPPCGGKLSNLNGFE